MPIQVNLDKAKNIFQTNLKRSVQEELKNIKIRESKGDNRFSSIVDYYQNLKIDLSDVKNVYELNQQWPEILPFCASNIIYKDFIQEQDNKIASCTLHLDFGNFPLLVDANNIAFVVDKGKDEYMFFPVEEVSNLNNSFKEVWFYDNKESQFFYNLYGELDRELFVKPNYFLSTKRILLQNIDNSVTIVIPACLRIDLDTFIAKLTYIPSTKKYTYNEVFDLEELPDPKYRDAWELIKV